MDIKANSRWIHKKTGQTARVMGVVENHVVGRYKGAMVWVYHKNDFLKNYEPTASEARGGEK